MLHIQCMHRWSDRHPLRTGQRRKKNWRGNKSVCAYYAFSRWKNPWNGRQRMRSRKALATSVGREENEANLWCADDVWDTYSRMMHGRGQTVRGLEQRERVYMGYKLNESSNSRVHQTPEFIKRWLYGKETNRTRAKRRNKRGRRCDEHSTRFMDAVKSRYDQPRRFNESVVLTSSTTRHRQTKNRRTRCRHSTQIKSEIWVIKCIQSQTCRQIDTQVGFIKDAGRQGQEQLL